MNDVSLNPEIVELEAEMEYEMPQYPVIPNPEGEPTEEITKMEIDDVIYEVTDAEARATLPTKVDKVEGKGLSTNDYTDTDKAIVDGVTSALDGKVDKVQGKGLSTNDFTDEEKTIVDGTPSALELKADKSDTYTKSEVNSALDNKVDKVNGKGLSENDFTDTLKSKLDGIEAEANKTVVDNSVTSTSTNPVESKAIYNLLNDLLPEATATGNPIAITNASGLNAKSLKVELEPIQDLHGYDSPWVGGGGKNKLKLNDGTYALGSTGVSAVILNGKVTISGTTSSSGGRTTRLSDYFTLKAGTYILSPIVNNPYVRGYLNKKSDNTVVGYTDGNSLTVSEDIEVYYGIGIEGGKTYSAETYPQLEVGTTITPYAPYSNICPISGRTQTTISVNSEDTTIQFGQTVYGGEVDVTSGGTSDEFEILDLGDYDWNLSGVRFYSQFGISLPIAPYAPDGDYSYVANALCTQYKTTSRSNIESENSAFSIHRAGTTVYITVHDERYSDKTTFKQAMSGVKVCCKLATPTTINTPANEISLLKGGNTITGDGDMELIYSKTPQ